MTGDNNQTLVITSENIDDKVAELIVGGYGININYDDPNNILSISTTGLQPSGNYAILVNNLVPASQLPSYVDDVLEYTNLASLPRTGESGKIYVALDSNKVYRWGGSNYIEISSSPGSTDSVAEGSTNLYFTNARASAAAPVQSVNGLTGIVTIDSANTGDITFNSSTISTANSNQNMIITTNGSGDIYIGADRNMIFDMNAFSAKGILLQDSQEDGYDNPDTPSLLKVGSIYHDTGRMVIKSDGRIVDGSGNLQQTYGGLILTNGDDTGLYIPSPTGSIFPSGSVSIKNNVMEWAFNNDGNLNLPAGKTINWGQNNSTLGPPAEGGTTDRLRLWDFEGTGTNFNYGIGVEPNHVWFSMDVNNGEGGFKFYSRNNQVFKISDDSKLMFPNGTWIAPGTFDNGMGGQSGVSLNCAVGYELNWQASHLKNIVIGDSAATPQTIYIDSPLQFPGTSQNYMTVNASGITFPDGSTQTKASTGNNTTVINLTYTSILSTDASLGDIFDIMLNGNTTLNNPINPVNGKTLRWRITQDSNGNRTVTLGDKFNIPSSASTTLPWSTVANKMDILAATYHAGRDKWDIVAFVPGY